MTGENTRVDFRLRWNAVIKFKDGTLEDHAFEELEELHDIVERGPDWKMQLIMRLG